MTRFHHDTTTLRIGPGCDDPLEAARQEARRETDPAHAKAVARRLVVAFVLCVVIALACFVLVPQWLGVRVPAWVPLLSFLAILGGTVATTPPGPKRAPAEEDAGRPVGCCSGPRCLSVPRDER